MSTIAATKNFSELVTYKTVVTLILTAIGICGTIAAFIYTQHLNSLHPGALSTVEFRQFELRVMDSIANQNLQLSRHTEKVDKEIGRILDKLDKITVEIRK